MSNRPFRIQTALFGKKAVFSSLDINIDDSVTFVSLLTVEFSSLDGYLSVKK